MSTALCAASCICFRTETVTGEDNVIHDAWSLVLHVRRHMSMDTGRDTWAWVTEYL